MYTTIKLNVCYNTRIARAISFVYLQTINSTVKGSSRLQPVSVSSFLC